MDFSTIDIEALKRLPTWDGGTNHWSVQQSVGNGCFLDAPGYPTYFTKCVYHNGNQPRFGPQMIIAFEGEFYVVATEDDSPEDTKKLLRKLWKPLPFDHVRVQLWTRAMYRHLASCYRDDEKRLVDDSSSTFIYPVPAYKLKTFRDDERFSDEWRDKAKAEVEAYNADVTARTKELATPDNHAAVRGIREFYPTHIPCGVMIVQPPQGHEGDWWETEAEQPSITDCKPRNGIGHATHKGVGWCQWCGWRGSVV